MHISGATSGIDPELPAYRAMLQNLQGNILKAHGRDYVHLICVRFIAPTSSVWSWMRAFAAERLTPARRQLRERSILTPHPAAIRTFGNFFLSAAGYVALGLDPGIFEVRFPPPRGATDVSFKNGMEHAGAVLGDPPSQEWEEPYRDQLIHAMILLADDDLVRLERVSGQVANEMEGIAVVMAREVGNVLRDRAGRRTEHFGFVDECSQPLFLADQVRQAFDQGGTDRWNPGAPLDLVLHPDPFVAREGCFGSFLVYRKLDQDVAGFAERITWLASAIGCDADLARALVIGRFQDGTPVITSRQPLGIASNNFNFSSDPYGVRCPLHAHIRKANPRGGSLAIQTGATLLQERQHSIVRRGIPYGIRQPSGELPRCGVGLLFMCFQRSIANQFAFVQRRWLGNPDFPRPGGACLDPVIGRTESGDPKPKPFWPSPWGSDRSRRFSFHGFVTLKGGEFFFAPSLPFLLGQSPQAQRGRQAVAAAPGGS